MPLPPQNLLAAEASPYLRQHAANPVHWRPWGKAALAEARELDRPILLSVGYAACHWCHVMAHESFEDEAVAAVMNRLFVNIKVDREERPDIDQIYMTALAATGEQGGWPLTMFLTPSAEPFWGGTYFPREPRYGRPGFVQVLEAIARAWNEKKAAITEDAGRLAIHVANQLSPAATPAEASPQAHDALADSILAATDMEKGGLRGSPKFPNAPYMTALWLHWLRSGDPRHRDAFLTSLSAMLNGGIYDHVGGGLCRYSTDADWIVPHFEKMLYDNAQLLTLCSWALGATGDDLFRMRIEQTVSWLCREMRTGDGLFTSSLDADSEGVEGKYYTWDHAGIESALGDDAEAFFSFFALASPPDWEGDTAILRRVAPAAREEARVAGMLERLRQARGRRIRPARDDKVIIEWNGLAIRALAQVARQLDRPDWLDVAAATFRNVTESTRSGRLPHSMLGTSRQFPALSSDYAALINAAVTLHEATSSPEYLDQAAGLLDMLERWHGDGDGSYFLTSSDAEDVPMRVRGDVDEATSSANSLVIDAIGRLASARADPALAGRAERAAVAAAGRATARRHGQAGILNAVLCVMEPRRLVIVEPKGASLFVPEANRAPDPRRVDIVVDCRTDGTADSLPDGTRIDPARPAAYLCLGTRCLPPVGSATALRSLLTDPEKAA